MEVGVVSRREIHHNNIHRGRDDKDKKNMIINELYTDINYGKMIIMDRKIARFWLT